MATAKKATAKKATTKKAVPAKKAAPAVKKASAPAKKAAPAVKKAAAPAKKASPAPVKKAAAPAKKTAAPTKKVAAPVKKTAAPTKKAAAPVKKTAAPAKKSAAAPVKKATPVTAPAKKATPAPAPAPPKKAVALLPVPKVVEKVTPKVPERKPVRKPFVVIVPEKPVVKGVTKDGLAYTKDFDVKFLTTMRAALFEEKARATGQAVRLEDEALQLIEEHEMGDVQFDDEGGEGDTMVVERERDLALSAQARQTIAEIDAAIARLATGAYGYSVESGRPIPRERLEAIPWATVLVEEKVGGIGRR
ncbi:unannotated protein [freshwater metagenome]|uniref:Unannotated protein n=1 Tax=freshwater metagenome TaxID=449393 RepID=A0A6J7KNU5_9ZZZZ|nr:hypothetical protein [Actinomycetota bacterium]